MHKRYSIYFVCLSVTSLFWRHHCTHVDNLKPFIFLTSTGYYGVFHIIGRAHHTCITQVVVARRVGNDCGSTIQHYLNRALRVSS